MQAEPLFALAVLFIPIFKEENTMATAKKLRSGSWRVQIFSHYEFVQQPDGSVKKKRIYESFTCDDPSNRGKREAERLAAEYAATKERMTRTDYTLQEAMPKRFTCRLIKTSKNF